MPLVAQDERQAAPAVDAAADVPARKPRGFAALTPEQRAAVSRKGGRRAHELGRAHEYDVDEAARAGKKGGTATARKGAAYMAKLGKLGGRKPKPKGES